MSVARRQREAKKVVKSREKSKVAIGGTVRKRRMGMKKTIQTMKRRRRKRRMKKVPSVVVVVSCFCSVKLCCRGYTLSQQSIFYII